MAFNDTDSATFATFWVVMLTLRGPALHLHGRGAPIAKWARGGYVVGRRYGPLLLIGFWASVMCVLLPRKLIPFTLATVFTAIHQFGTLHRGQGHSYMMVFVSNFSLAVSSIVCLCTGKSLSVAINAASPAVIEAYALLMFFAALGKFNTAFFDGKRSAATVHVIGSLENLFTMLPDFIRNMARSAVKSAGSKGMDVFFIFTAWLGAFIETAVFLFMYLNYPILQVWIMYLMHGLFAFTAFDFSVASSGVMPIFGIQNEGAVSRWLGWLISPWASVLIAGGLAWVVLTPASHENASKEEAKRGHIAKLQTLTLLCRGWYFLAAPVLYIGSAMPHGAMLLGLGTEHRAAAEEAMQKELGQWGYVVIQIAAFITLGISILNGSGPYAGWKTLGTYTTLYSNILVERDPNHYITPLTRAIGMPWCTLMTDLLTVTSTNAPTIAVQLVLAPVTPLFVFKDLIEENPEWALAGRCHWAPSPPTWHTLLEFAYPEMKAQPVIPYETPYFQLRCLISELVNANPEFNFYVEYEHKQKKMRFERKDGVTLSESDLRLAEQPPLLQRCLCNFRPLPIGEDSVLRMHS